MTNASTKNKGWYSLSWDNFTKIIDGFRDGLALEPCCKEYDTWEEHHQKNYELGREIAAYCRALRFSLKWPKNTRMPDWLPNILAIRKGTQKFSPPPPPSLGDL